MIKKQQKWIALLVTFAFAWLLQVSTMPLAAANTTEKISSANVEQAPRFIEEEGDAGYQAKKKSIVPIILIGVGVVAVAAVLFLVVLKTNYDITGTWDISIHYATTEFQDYTSTWVFSGNKESGTFMETQNGNTYPGTYKVTNKKDVWFKYNDYTDTFVGKFDGKDKMSGTFSTDSYDGTWTASKKSSSTASRPAPLARPAFAAPKSKRG